MRRKLVVIMFTVMLASISIVGCGKDEKTSVTESKKVLTVTEHKRSEQDDTGQKTEKEEESTYKRKNVTETEKVSKKDESEKENSKSDSAKNGSKKEEAKEDTSKKKDVLNKTEKSSANKKQDELKNSASSTNSSSLKSTTSTNAGNSQENSNQTETKPAHQHNYVKQTHTVHHDATGHNEQYEVQAAWDEEKTTYEDYAWSCCNVCGADCTADPAGHAYQHAIKGEGGGHHTEYDSRPVTTTVHHDAVYATYWVQDSAAYDETVVDGYVCSCGARK